MSAGLIFQRERWRADADLWHFLNINATFGAGPPPKPRNLNANLFSFVLLSFRRHVIHTGTLAPCMEQGTFPNDKDYLALLKLSPVLQLKWVWRPSTFAFEELEKVEGCCWFEARWVCQVQYPDLLLFQRPGNCTRNITQCRRDRHCSL